MSFTGHVAVVRAVDDDEGTEGAGADAVDLLEVSVRSGVVPPAPTPASRSSCSSRRGAPRTWQAVPMHTVHVCLPRGSVSEAVVEGGDPVDLGGCESQVGRRLPHRLLGQVAELGLQVVQDVDELARIRRG